MLFELFAFGGEEIIDAGGVGGPGGKVVAEAAFAEAVGEVAGEVGAGEHSQEQVAELERGSRASAASTGVGDSARRAAATERPAWAERRVSTAARAC